MTPAREPEATQAGANGELSRAAKRHVRRLAKQQVEQLEIKEASVPAAFRSARADGSAEAGVVGGLLTAEQRRHQQKLDRVQMVGIGALPTGRPSEYTPEEGDTICAWIQGGGSLNGYLKNTGRMAETVYRWLRQHADFSRAYAHAERDRADTLAEETLEIADSAAINPTIEGVQAAKLRVDARKWIVSKLSPTKWGDRQTVEHSASVNIRIGIPPRPRDALAPVVEVV